VYGAGQCGSSCRNAFTEVIPETVERNTRDSLRRAKLEDRSATRLTDRTTLRRLELYESTLSVWTAKGLLLVENFEVDWLHVSPL